MQLWDKGRALRQIKSISCPLTVQNWRICLHTCRASWMCLHAESDVCVLIVRIKG